MGTSPLASHSPSGTLHRTTRPATRPLPASAPQTGPHWFPARVAPSPTHVDLIWAHLWTKRAPACSSAATPSSCLPTTTAGVSGTTCYRAGAWPFASAVNPVCWPNSARSIRDRYVGAHATRPTSRHRPWPTCRPRTHSSCAKSKCRCYIGGLAQIGDRRWASGGTGEAQSSPSERSLTAPHLSSPLLQTWMSASPHCPRCRCGRCARMGARLQPFPCTHRLGPRGEKPCAPLRSPARNLRSHHHSLFSPQVQWTYAYGLLGRCPCPHPSVPGCSSVSPRCQPVADPHAASQRDDGVMGALFVSRCGGSPSLDFRFAFSPDVDRPRLTPRTRAAESSTWRS